MTMEKTITEETTEETIIENKGIGIEVAVEIITGIPIGTEKIQERTICKVEITVMIGPEQGNPDYNQEGKTEERIEEIVIGLCQDHSLGPGLDPVIE